ncbi:hypothetical protein HHI36_018455 [Cryptolaemus montrouzieri]|uniref:Uncharacterized protein n=1 Tax=Cryptolaemus montrouzieri TaxID=559131 RepID=A0ABD2P058_9CUCU
MASKENGVTMLVGTWYGEKADPQVSPCVLSLVSFDDLAEAGFDATIIVESEHNCSENRKISAMILQNMQLKEPQIDSEIMHTSQIEYI